MIRKILRHTVLALAACMLLVVVYFIAALGLSAITVNAGSSQGREDDVEIYVSTNGVHTDIIVPYESSCMHWDYLITPADTKMGVDTPRYVAFGWGDKGFYLETPTWGDLTFRVAFKALFFLGTSAMHVTFYNNVEESENCRKILIDREQYLKLVAYIYNSFSLTNTGAARRIAFRSSLNNDAYYEAEGTYSFLNTCNTWTNSALKAANLRACLWTPFDTGILRKYAPDARP